MYDRPFLAMGVARPDLVGDLVDVEDDRVSARYDTYGQACAVVAQRTPAAASYGLGYDPRELRQRPLFRAS
jgi:hypothetical protein